MIRPAKFIDPDEVYWKENTKKFTEKTGVDVKVDFVSWEDLRPQLAVMANTGAGADLLRQLRRRSAHLLPTSWWS